MPTVSLRLTEEELASLNNWAHDSRRSLQKEIIWRLFADKGVLDVVREHVVKEVEGQLPERESVDGAEVQNAVPDEHAGVRPLPTPTTPSSRSGSCPMSPPRGTKCKVCGKVHPL